LYCNFFDPLEALGRYRWCHKAMCLVPARATIPVGIGIPIHRHFDMDEAFYVIEGSGSLILDDVRYPIGKGASIFIPMNSWHGFENASHELVLLWTVAPTGLECFFREIATRPGVPPIQRSKQQLNEIASKYGTEFR